MPQRANESRRGPYRRLTDAKANDRRAKGLYFWCYEKYHAGHRCRFKELQVLMVTDDDVWEDIGEEGEE